MLLKSVPVLVGGANFKFGDVDLHLAHEVILGERIFVPDHHTDDAVYCEWTLKTDIKVFLPPWKPSLVNYLTTK